MGLVNRHRVSFWLAARVRMAILVPRGMRIYEPRRYLLPALNYMYRYRIALSLKKPHRIDFADLSASTSTGRIVKNYKLQKFELFSFFGDLYLNFFYFIINSI